MSKTKIHSNFAFWQLVQEFPFTYEAEIFSLFNIKKKTSLWFFFLKPPAASIFSLFNDRSQPELSSTTTTTPIFGENNRSTQCFEGKQSNLAPSQIQVKYRCLLSVEVSAFCSTRGALTL